MEDKLRALFVEFKLGRSLSPMRSQHGESSDRKENPPEKEEQATESSYQRMRVDFLDGKTETRGMDFVRGAILPDWSEKQLLGTSIEGLKSEIREVKARQPIYAVAAISFARLLEERLNQEDRRTKVIARLVALRLSAPSSTSRPPQPKKLSRELRDRSAKGLCWTLEP
ncbi:hypothetical protein BHE74_00058328 [Ensete ventricosum]|nr:hypothetical protein BHE74_00058328 [Ensete ventricosum]